MGDDTIIGSSPVGKRLGSIQKREKNYCLIFGNKRLPIVTKITIGRASDNDVVIDNKLASRYHAFIQKIKNEYFLKDLNSTNGTHLNGVRIPPDKYVKLAPGDVVTIGKTNLIVM